MEEIDGTPKKVAPIKNIEAFQIEGKKVIKYIYIIKLNFPIFNPNQLIQWK